MKKCYAHFKILWIFFLIISGIFINSCAHKTEINSQKNQDEADEYDSPNQAAEFEFKRTKDPATGQIPMDKMWAAVLKTEALKNINANSPSPNSPSSPNSLTALVWTERGSFSDAVGPSNSNKRPGNGITSGRIRALWVDQADPTGKTVWVGGVDGGLWKTNDVTATTPTWSLVNDFLSNLAVTGICQDPTNVNTMYFCTGEAYLAASTVNGNGVFKSTDHGVTWTLLPSTSTLVKCTRILCDAVGNVYVSTMGISVAVGLQRSTNGGASWTSINPFSTTSRIVDFEISSTGTMHVSGGINSAPGIGGYRYTNNPATATTTTGWNTATTPFIFPEGTNGYARTELAVLGNTVYAALAHPASGETSKIDSIAKSTDGGANWITLGLTPQNVTDLNGSGQGWYAIGLAIDPSNANSIIVGSLNMLKSNDGGITYTKISEWIGTTGQYCHADQHNITWYDNGNKLLVGHDGGLSYSANKGTTISDKNTGLRLKQFYGVAVHPTSTNYFLCGAQDNGTHQFNGPGLTTSIEVLGGDGGITAIDQNEPLFQTGAYVYANFRRTTDGGSTWQSSGSSSTEGQFINPYDFDNTTNKVYAGYNAGNYLRWEDPHSGFTFTPVALPTLGTGEVSAATVSPYTTNRVYFGTTNGKVIKADNAVEVPVDVDISPTGIPATGYVNSITVGTTDQNLIATLTNYGVMNIWSTTNGGTSWVGCDGNLPDMPVYWSLYHPDGDTKVYIATETGIWSTQLLNGSSTVWVPESTFPTVKTVMLKYRASDRTLAAATHGRGLWTSIIPFTSCTPAAITTQPLSNNTCVGNTINFKVVASGTTPLVYQWQVSTDGGISYTNITNGGVYSNATTSTLTITGATATMNGYLYRVLVTGNCAPFTATSSAATLTINAEALVITSQPVSTTVCAGSTTSFSVVISGTVVGYQWQENINGTWANITNTG
ncbi:MAG: immunoglobulin domain-containing protein, partial [Ferruginibacter sp.]